MGMVAVMEQWNARQVAAGAAAAVAAAYGSHGAVAAETAAEANARFAGAGDAQAGPQQLKPTLGSKFGARLGAQLGLWVRRYTVRNERLRLCETLALGGRRSLVLVECDGQRFLAGLSADGVQTLVPVTAAAATRAEEAA